MDKFQSIRFFLKLCDTLSFKDTAAYFHVPASKVSRSIKALEGELGVTLLERTTRQVRLTDAGAWYRGEVTGPMRAIIAADELADLQSKAPMGTVRLTALPGYGDIRLVSVLKEFRQAYPNIVCDVEFSDRYLDLSSGEVDVAIRATSAPPEYLVARKLHSNRFALVASPGYLRKHGVPGTIEELEQHAALPYRGPNGMSPWQAVEHDGGLRAVAIRPVLISNHGIMLREAALSGEGIAFLPEWGVAEAIQEGLLEEIRLSDAKLILSTTQEMSMYLLYHPEKARLGKVRVLVDFLAEALEMPSQPS